MSFSADQRDKEDELAELRERMGGASREIGFRPGAIQPGAPEAPEVIFSAGRSAVNAIKIIIGFQVLAQLIAFGIWYGMSWERATFEHSAVRLRADQKSVNQRQISTRSKNRTTKRLVYDVVVEYQWNGHPRRETLVLDRAPASSDDFKLEIFANPSHPSGSRLVEWKNPVPMPFASYLAAGVGLFFGTFLAGVLLLMSQLIKNPLIAASMKQSYEAYHRDQEARKRAA